MPEGKARAGTEAAAGGMTKRILPGASAAVSLVLYGALSIIMWRIYYSPSWDLGIFTQLLNDYAHLQAPIVDIKGPGYNLWGDHFHPILWLLMPVFKIWPSGLTLMLLQAVLFAASAWPVASYAAQKLPAAGAWALSLAYVGSYGLLNSVTSQFHEIAFAVPLLAFGLVWWLRGHHLAGAIAIALLVFVKEDMGLTVAAFGIAVWLRQRATKYQLGLFVWGVLWFAVTVLLILPAFNNSGQYDYTDNVSALDALGAGAQTKLATLGALVLAAGAVGLRSPLMLMVLPTLAWRFVGNVEGYWGLSFHYTAGLVPIAALALIDGIAGPGWTGWKRAGAAKSGAAGPAGAGTEAAAAAEREDAAASAPEPVAQAYAAQSSAARTEAAQTVRERTLGTWAPAAAAAGVIALAGSTNINLLWESERYAIDAGPAVQAAEQYGTVATDIRLLAYLAPKTHTYWYGRLDQVKPDAVLLRPSETGQTTEEWAEERLGGDWTTVLSEGGYELAVPAAQGQG
ncbi:DUF2079 domain-containing protein [Brevibacterium sp. 91QC2O2]|uniref:DUF2079 domain-containing protein n=1 Tax=Brevibacterium sp. 91QC2O2 TaxID=2968458 RepID=UPI00211C1390|nr:DUF2079 domain-containing protein [Brevibacterium sp. 91QC2O2]MCQ9368225.1 DUF2079 domain-containing protein [Brevibacterium sp. 91QC2O2]